MLAGDIDNRWDGLDQFANWPVPVVFVAGNHEFDRREWSEAWLALRQQASSRHPHARERVAGADGAHGERVRFLGTTRWTDSTWKDRPAGRRRQGRALLCQGDEDHRGGELMNAHFVREEGVELPAMARAAIAGTDPVPRSQSLGPTVVITHSAPAGAARDPRYGLQPGTSSFLNDDESLIPMADVWIHGHVHRRHGYEVAPCQGPHLGHRQPQGHGHKGRA